jgi:hypothetical protein
MAVHRYEIVSTVANAGRGSHVRFSFFAGFLFQSAACSAEWCFQMLALFG